MLLSSLLLVVVVVLSVCFKSLGLNTITDLPPGPRAKHVHLRAHRPRPRPPAALREALEEGIIVWYGMVWYSIVSYSIV